MNIVPAYALDNETGEPVSHGVVERCRARFRQCVQHYCLVKQEDLHVIGLAYACIVCMCVGNHTIGLYSPHWAISLVTIMDIRSDGTSVCEFVHAQCGYV